MYEKFHWKSSEGVEITLPRMGNIKAAILRRHRKEQEIDFVFSLLEELQDDEMLAKVDELGMDDLNKLIEAWQKPVTPGESSGSST